jgi:hypothetical protein
MFEHIIDYPWPCTFDTGLVVCIPATITLEIEPTNDGTNDWWVAAAYIEGNKLHDKLVDPGKPKDHKIPPRDPMLRAIRDYARKHCATAISQKWDDWISSRAERIADARRAN